MIVRNRQGKARKKPQIIEGKFEVLPLFAALFAVGIVCSQSLGSSGFPVFLTAAAGCILITLHRALEPFRFSFLCIGAIMAGAFYGNVRIVSHEYTDFLKLDSTRGELTGTFTGEFRRYRADKLSFKVKNSTYAFDRQEAIIPGLVSCSVVAKDTIPEPEQVYQLSGRFISPEPGKLPIFKATSIKHVANGFFWNRLAGKLQRMIRDSLNQVLPRRHAGIAIGFILGDTSQISPDDRQLFRETGISHLLAVSGQHIMVLIMLLAAILHWTNIPPISRSILIIISMTLYALTTSGSPSIWRALTMYISIAAVIHTEAFPSPIRPIAIAAMILLLINPGAIFEAAFQLSFVAILSIVFLRRPIEHMLKKILLPDFLSRYLAVTFAANLGTMPMVAYLFGTVSAAALVVNPLVLWSFGYILPAVFIISGLAIIAPAFAIYFAPGLSLFLDALIALLQKFNGIPGSYFYIGNLPGITIATAYALLLFVAATFNRRQIRQIVELQNSGSAQVNNPPIYKKIEKSDKTTTARPAGIANPENKNLFRDQNFVRDIDSMMLSCKRRALKNANAVVSTEIPLRMLSIDNQNLLYQIIDLDQKTLAAEPERLLQAQVFCMSLAGSEILNRISFHIFPAPEPGELAIGFVVRDRHLAASVLADNLLGSSLLTRAVDESLMHMISRAQNLFFRGKNLIRQILESEPQSSAIDTHFALRRDLLCWLREFIEFDNDARKKQTATMRSEL